MAHVVTIKTKLEDKGTEDERRCVDTVTFTCDAPPEADCRRHPLASVCDCESWHWDETGERDEAGHQRVAGQPCWLTDWFGSDAAVYAGDDYDDMRDDCAPAVDRTGEINVSLTSGEWPEWTFAESTNSEHGI